MPGRILLCSRGIFFEPDDLRIALYKFPFKSMPACPAPVLDSSSSLAFECKQVVRMKKGGVVGPYATQSFAPTASPVRSGGTPVPSAPPDLPTFTVTLVHSDTSALLTLASRLWSIASTTNRSREQDLLQPLIDSRHMVGVPLWVCLCTYVARPCPRLLCPPPLRPQGLFDLSLLLDYRERPIVGTLCVEKIRPLVTCPCRLVVTSEALYLQPVPLNNIGESVSKYKIRNIVDTVRRRRLLREVGAAPAHGGVCVTLPTARGQVGWRLLCVGMGGACMCACYWRCGRV